MKTKIKITFEVELNEDFYLSRDSDEVFTLEGDKISQEWTPFPDADLTGHLCTSLELFNLSWSADKPAYTKTRGKGVNHV